MDGTRILNCRSDFPDNWMTSLTNPDPFAAGFLSAADGSVVDPTDGTRLIYTPGLSNIVYGPNGMTPGAPVTGFSLFSSLPPAPGNTVDDFPSAARPFYLDRFRYDPSTNDQLARADADLWRPYERFSLVMNGHLDLGWGHNEEAYFEGYYFNRTNKVIAAREQIFPGMAAMIPLVDDSNNLVLGPAGETQMVDNPMNPFDFDVSPVLTLDDLPQTFDVELQQIRLVGGITGDLPFSDNWGYDISLSYDRSAGHASQQVLLENQLFFATQNLGAVWDGVAGGTGTTGDVVCDPRFPAPGGLITPAPCVPFNMFADSIYGDGVTSDGRFSSQAERDYLLGNRTNRTVTEQSILQAFITGDLFDLPNGESVGTAFGVEFREDQIDSQNDAIGVLGLNAAENALQEGETRGSRSTFDVYGEISAPLVVDASWAELLQLDAAIRYTDDENFGGETVYKIGGLWRFNEWVAFSSSFNTSFRAPNLREQFLADQAGALPGGDDPCHNSNIIIATPGPGLDRLLANCALSGADVTQLGTQFTVAIPTSVGGAAALNPETSESVTATLTLSQPWTDRFDFDVALTYFDITIEDTVRALEPGTIVSRCYNDQPNLASPFCDRVFRDRANATPFNNFISFVRAGFVNTGEETANGYDLTTRFGMDLDRVNLTWSTATTFMNERLSQEFPPSEADANGSAIVDDVGRIGNPEWTFQSTIGAAFGNFDLVLQSRYWSDTEFAEGLPNPVITDTAGLCLSGCPVGQDPEVIFAEDGFTDYGFATTTQLRPEIGPVRPVTAAEGQWHHDLGLTYNWESAALTVGINNLTDEEPPLISQEAGPNRNNAVASARYDLIGTSYFVNFTKTF
jgi:iron complex outermembrane receptor protein